MGLKSCAIGFFAISTVVFGVSTSAFAEYKENYIGDMGSYTAVYEDTLVHLARDYDLGFVELRAANPDLDPWIPGAGAKVVLPSRHLLPDAPRKGMVINLPEMRIYAYLNGDGAPFTYPIGIGREGLATPTGNTSVIRKKEGPVWRPTDRMRKENPELPEAVYPGPENPMGTHAIYLGWPTYAIHGTNKPFGIGRRVSSGCIRMYPADIIKFFDQVPVGTKVSVITQSIKVQWIGDDLYLEAHPDMEQALAMEDVGEVEHKKLSDDDMALIIDKAGMYADRLNWPRIRIAVRERRGYPIRIARAIGGKVAADEGDVSSSVSEQKLSKKPISKSSKEVDLKVSQGDAEAQTSKPQ